MLTNADMIGLIAIAAEPGNVFEQLLAPLTQIWERYPRVLGWLGVSSLLLLVGSALALPWLLTRLPADYLRRPPKPPHRSLALRFGIGFARNAMAVLLAFAGLAMLVLPGQGLLTLLASLALSTLPGKRRLLQWVASRPPVLRAINRVRARAGVPALEGPED